MSVSIIRYLARCVKRILACAAEFVDTQPILQPGCLYTQQQIIKKFRVSKITLGRWEQAGLPGLRPGTSSVFYASEDLIRIMRIPEDELPAYEPKYKQKE